MLACLFSYSPNVILKEDRGIICFSVLKLDTEKFFPLFILHVSVKQTDMHGVSVQ